MRFEPIMEVLCIVCLLGLRAPVVAEAAAREPRARVRSLDGQWDFATDTAGTFTPAEFAAQSPRWRRALVPLSWQAQFDDLRDYQGVAWYKKTVRLAPVKPGETVQLHFEAVDYLAHIFINHVKAAEHEGGYLPFDVDITSYLKPGDNEIMVRVMDPVPKSGTEGIRYEEIPHGKQSWYVQTSGLWRPGELRVKPERFIEQLRIMPSIDGRVRCMLRLHKDVLRPEKTRTLRLQIRDPKGRICARSARPISGAARELGIDLTVGSPLLWSPDQPLLYTLEAAIEDGDTRKERFGFRRLETREGRLYLNGKSFYLIGALDQDFYPETISTTPSLEYVKKEMRRAKQMGLNTLRVHITVPDERYLQAADELGLLLWCEIPNWDTWTPQAAHRAEQTLEGMLEHEVNHPSVCILSIINESWGIDLGKDTERAWLKSMVERAKRAAPGCLVVDNSACWGNFHIKTDINDYHCYWAIPEKRNEFDRTLADLARRPAWVFSPYGDAEEKKSEALMLSEFGNWGLPDLPREEPWWFTRKFGDARVVHPEGVRGRFSDYHYNRVFASFGDLAGESQRAQWEALKYEIESLRLVPEIQGYIVTEFTDVNWESNGLLDMWRRPKVCATRISSIQNQDIVIARTEKQNYRSGQTITLMLALSCYDHCPSELRWKFADGKSGVIPLRTDPNALGSQEIAVRESLCVAAPRVASPERMRFAIQAVSRDEKVIAENTCDIFVYPPRQSLLPDTIGVVLHDPLNILTALTPGEEAKARTVIVTDCLDRHTMSRLEEGRAVLCLVDSNTVVPSGFPIQVMSRDSAWYDGNWAGALHWIDPKSVVFKDLAFARHLGFEAAEVAPQSVLTGLEPDAFKSVPAGMFVGWMHLNSACILPVRVGKGKLVLCTYQVARAIAKNDPYAEELYRALLLYALEPDDGRTSVTWQMEE